MDADSHYAIEYLAKQGANPQEVIEAGRRMNIIRNRLMDTVDGIDSYDIFRGFSNRQYKLPSFPYDTDPDKHIKISSTRFTLGARAALSAYYKKFAQNVSQQTPEQVNTSMTAMGLTPTARVDVGRQILVTEVDRRITNYINGMAMGSDVDFLTLIQIMGVALRKK